MLERICRNFPRHISQLSGKGHVLNTVDGKMTKDAKITEEVKSDKKGKDMSLRVYISLIHTSHN